MSISISSISSPITSISAFSVVRTPRWGRPMRSAPATSAIAEFICT